MKAIFKLSIALMIVASIATGAAQAQRKNDNRARGLFISKRADAMRILILKNEEGTLVPVDPSRSFKQGDQIKVSFQSNFEGHVYIVNVTPGGKKCVLFPYGDNMDNSIVPDQRYDLPFGNDTIEFDDEKGTEVLQVIMSRERIPFLDAATQNPQGCLNDTAANAAAELASDNSKSNSKSPKPGIAGENVAMVLPQSGPGAIRSRNIILAAGKDKDPQGSVVAISDKKGANGKLTSGEVAVFEIRLQHN